MKKVISMLLVIAMMAALAGCGSKAPAEVGKYSIESMEFGDTKMDKKELESLAEMAGESVDLDSMFSLEMKEDGTFKMTSDGESVKGTYEDGKMTVDGDSISYTYKDGVLTLEEDGMKMTFKKK